jgi:hypothetical protein
LVIFLPIFLQPINETREADKVAKREEKYEDVASEEVEVLWEYVVT